MKNSSNFSFRPSRPWPVSLYASSHALTNSLAASLYDSSEPNPPTAWILSSSNSWSCSCSSSMSSWYSLILSLSVFFFACSSLICSSLAFICSSMFSFACLLAISNVLRSYVCLICFSSFLYCFSRDWTSSSCFLIFFSRRLSFIPKSDAKRLAIALNAVAMMPMTPNALLISIPRETNASPNVKMFCVIVMMFLMLEIHNRALLSSATPKASNILSIPSRTFIDASAQALMFSFTFPIFSLAFAYLSAFLPVSSAFFSCNSRDSFWLFIIASQSSLVFDEKSSCGRRLVFPFTCETSPLDSLSCS